MIVGGLNEKICQGDDESLFRSVELGALIIVYLTNITTGNILLTDE